MATSIGPTQSRAIWVTDPKKNNRSSASSSSSQPSPDEVQQSSQAANDQIVRNQQLLADNQREGEASLEHLHQGFQEAESNEQVKGEDAVEKQKTKGYEQLRELKRRQQAELARVKREGEKELRKAQDYYRDTAYEQVRKGEQDLETIKKHQNREQDYIGTLGRGDLASEKAEQDRRVSELAQQQDKKFEQIREQSQKEFERIRKNTDVSLEAQTEKFQQTYQNTLGESNASLENLTNNANRQIKQIRQDTAQKLSAYSSRQSDPFYKMVDLNAQLRDEGDRFILTARVPSHEQDHISVGLRGNTLVLSGNRKNDERLEVGPGKFRGTSSYQSFQESFPLNAPINRNELLKEFKGDQIIVTIPKSLGVAPAETYVSKAKPEPAKAERPHFPGNLPGIFEGSNETEVSSNAPKRGSGKTLI